MEKRKRVNVIYCNDNPTEEEELQVEIQSNNILLASYQGKDFTTKTLEEIIKIAEENGVLKSKLHYIEKYIKM